MYNVITVELLIQNFFDVYWQILLFTKCFWYVQCLWHGYKYNVGVACRVYFIVQLS